MRHHNAQSRDRALTRLSLLNAEIAASEARIKREREARGEPLTLLDPDGGDLSTNRPRTSSGLKGDQAIVFVVGELSTQPAHEVWVDLRTMTALSASSPVSTDQKTKAVRTYVGRHEGVVREMAADAEQIKADVAERMREMASGLAVHWNDSEHYSLRAISAGPHVGDISRDEIRALQCGHVPARVEAWLRGLA